MTKIILLIILIASVGFIFTGCSGREDNSVVVIGDRFFVNQMEEIFLNYQRYLGREIRYEGIFETLRWSTGDYTIVFRYIMGCCGPEERIGFEVDMDGTEPFPDDTWVEVTGILELDDEFLLLRVVSIIEMDERGADVVF